MIKKRIKSIIFKINLILLTLITLNECVLIFTRGYEISLGLFKISSHRAGRLFIAQVILAFTLRIFFTEEMKNTWKKSRISEAFEFLSYRKIILISVLAIILISTVAYYQTQSGFFLSDDFEYLSLFDKSDFFDMGIFFGYLKKFGLIRPISILSLYGDYLIWKLNPVGFHLTNLIIHILNSFFIFLIFFIILKERYISMLSAFLFSLYPIHLESVAWISGRFDILCAFFFLLAILFFLISHRNNSRFSFYYVLSLVSFIFALFSKEMAIVLPLVLILFDLFFSGKTELLNVKNKLKIHFPYWLILFGYVIMRIIYLGNLGGYSYPEGKSFLFHGNLYYNLKNLVLRPFGPLFVPLNQSLFSNYIFIKNCILFILAVMIFASPFRKKLNFKLLLFGLLFILLTVIPVFKILYVSETLEGARFLYLPSLGACLIIAALLKISFFKKEFVGKTVNLVIPLVVLILFMSAALRNGSSWIKAAEISEKISYQTVDRIQNVKFPKVIYALNLPDNYKGAYIFRNGFSASLYLLGKPDYIEIININKIEKSQLRKEEKYLILKWENDTIQLISIPYLRMIHYLKQRSL